MNKQQQAAIAAKFEAVFGYPYEQGKARLGELLRRSVNMGAFSGAPIDVSRVSMSESDFTLIAFFAFIGAGALSEIGVEVPAGPPAIEAATTQSERRQILRAQPEALHSLACPASDETGPCNCGVD